MVVVVDGGSQRLLCLNPIIVMVLLLFGLWLSLGCHNYLIGITKPCVKHVENVDDAFKTFGTTFWPPLMIWNRRRRKVLISLHKIEWGSCVSVRQRNSLARLLDFIVEAEAFAGQHETYKYKLRMLSFKIWHIFQVHRYKSIQILIYLTKYLKKTYPRLVD